MVPAINSEGLKDRTKRFALTVIRLCRIVQPSQEGRIITRQLLRSATSVAANYRAVCRARSKAEFIARMGIAAEEVDEAVLWLELLTESGIVKVEMTEGLLKEAKELAAILTASLQTAKKDGVTRF